METNDLTQEFFDMWQKTYDATYGRVFNIPSIGPMREKQEKLIKNFYSFVNFYTALTKFNIDSQNAFFEATQKTHQRTIEKMKDANTDPDKYKDFYTVWIQTSSEIFKELLKSEKFVSDTGKLMSAFIEFQKDNRQIIEENYLKLVNIPTRTEIDDMNRELYSLKRTVKELNKRIEELNNK